MQRGINGYWVQKLIPEGLSALKQSLNIKITPQERPYSDDELLKSIDNTVSKFGRIPSWTQLRRETGISDKAFISRFGNEGIHEVFRYYLNWLKDKHPQSTNFELIVSCLGDQSNNNKIPPKPVKKQNKANVTKWPKLISRQFGPPLNFGNLIYEPINEQGVVFLFGMISKYLGFSIEYIGPDFPDCEAKRYIEGKTDRQQHVKIEFEYRSREYNHVYKNCDIIICWEDSWGSEGPNEPIPVWL
jgi:hypothetical protein